MPVILENIPIQTTILTDIHQPGNMTTQLRNLKIDGLQLNRETRNYIDACSGFCTSRLDFLAENNRHFSRTREPASFPNYFWV